MEVAEGLGGNHGVQTVIMRFLLFCCFLILNLSVGNQEIFMEYNSCIVTFVMFIFA